MSQRDPKAVPYLHTPGEYGESGTFTFPDCEISVLYKVREKPNGRRYDTRRAVDNPRSEFTRRSELEVILDNLVEALTKLPGIEKKATRTNLLRYLTPVQKGSIKPRYDPVHEDLCSIVEVMEQRGWLTKLIINAGTSASQYELDQALINRFDRILEEYEAYCSRSKYTAWPNEWQRDPMKSPPSDQP